MRGAGVLPVVRLVAGLTHALRSYLGRFSRASSPMSMPDAQDLRLIDTVLGSCSRFGGVAGPLLLEEELEAELKPLDLQLRRLTLTGTSKRAGYPATSRVWLMVIAARPLGEETISRSSTTGESGKSMPSS